MEGAYFRSYEPDKNRLASGFGIRRAIRSAGVYEHQKTCEICSSFLQVTEVCVVGNHENGVENGYQLAPKQKLDRTFTRTRNFDT